MSKTSSLPKRIKIKHVISSAVKETKENLIQQKAEKEGEVVQKKEQSIKIAFTSLYVNRV